MKMDREAFRKSELVWAAILDGLERAKQHGDVERFSYDGDGDSGEVIVDLRGGRSYVVELRETEED